MDLYMLRNELSSGRSVYDLPMRVTFYARVSTDSGEQVHSLKNQIDYYSELIGKNKNWEYIEGYTDEAVSGTSVCRRTGFSKMINDAGAGKFDFILTKEISRFSRNTLDSIKYTQQLLSYGVGVLFQSDNINTLLPDAELRLTIMSSIAQDEVRKTSERVKFGLRRAVDKGIVLGNSAIWGYRKAEGKLVIDEHEAETVRKIFRMYATENMGIRSVCTALGKEGIFGKNGAELSFSTVKGILTNPKYKGYYCGNKSYKYDYRHSGRKYFDEEDWVIYKALDIVPPIVSEELWDKANLLLKTRGEKMRENKTSYQNKYSYSGMVFCEEHGKPYHRAAYKTRAGKREVWQCGEYAKKGRAGCISPVVYTSELDMITRGICEMICSGLTDKLVKIYTSADRGEDAEVRKTEARILELRRRKDRLLDLNIEGRVSDAEFENRNIKFNDEIEAMLYKIEKFNLAGEEKMPKEEILCRAISEELKFDGGFNNQIISALFRRMEVRMADGVIKLRVLFKIFEEGMEYEIPRG